MFKAAIEYSMANQQTTRSLNDQNLSIEKQVLDGHAKLQKSALLLKKNNINNQAKLSDMNFS